MNPMDTCGTLGEECPGMFCGRVNLSDQTQSQCYSSCQACPTGFRVDNDSICQPCHSVASARDYLYFVFMCLVSLLIRYTVTTIANWKNMKSVWMVPLYIIPIAEVLIAMILTLVSLPPKGSVNLYSCPVEAVSDFYPIFFNPSLNYVNRIHCTYEVVYPLYSIVFIFFGFHFALHIPLLVTVLVLARFPQSRRYGLMWSPRTEYLWLIFFPVLVLGYSVLAGVIYYSFDYLTIVISLGSFAVLSTVLQSVKHGNFENPFKVYILPVQWLLVLGTMVFLSCGILSLTEWGEVSWRAYFLPLVLLLPLLHPLVTLFASPQLQFEAWGVDKLDDEFFSY